MKLKDLMSSYEKAEVKSASQRVLVATEKVNVVRVRTSENGNPIVMIDEPVKMFYDGEFKPVQSVVMFSDDVDAFKGSIDMRASALMLNGLKAKATVNVYAYEDESGDAAMTHDISIQLDDKNTAALISKCDRQVSATSTGNPF